MGLEMWYGDLEGEFSVDFFVKYSSFVPVMNLLKFNGNLMGDLLSMGYSAVATESIHYLILILDPSLYYY